MYNGTASSSNTEAPSETQAITVAGTSPTGTIDLTCLGSPSASATPPSLVDYNCSAVIDGAPSVALGMIFAVARAGLTTHHGVYAAVPDAEGLPSLGANLGTASATASVTPTGNGVSFGFDGQIILGGQTYHGQASGGTAFSSATALAIDVPPFSLSGASATGSISATCAGEFIGLAASSGGFAVGQALSVLGCDGSADGGSPGHTTLASLYLATGTQTHFGAWTTYGGLFPVSRGSGSVCRHRAALTTSGSCLAFDRAHRSPDGYLHLHLAADALDPMMMSVITAPIGQGPLGRRASSTHSFAERTRACPSRAVKMVWCSVGGRLLRRSACSPDATAKTSSSLGSRSS